MSEAREPETEAGRALLGSHSDEFIAEGNEFIRGTEAGPLVVDDMCPNCVTPWKCNGPHLASAESEPS